MTHLRLIEPPSSEPPCGGRALAPAISPHGPVPIEIDLQLSRLGQRALTGDRDALNTLHAAYRPRLDHWVRRACRSCFRHTADPSIEPEDIIQQAFLVFADLLLAWNGSGSLSGYLIAYFPWRLSDAVRRLADVREHRSLDVLPSPLLIDESVAADEAIALLEALAASFPEHEGKVLLFRIRDGLTWDEVAAAVGFDRRTVLRDWKRILVQLRASLRPGP
jgi:RNA polymerase sigma factor (sigma-70 family)